MATRKAINLATMENEEIEVDQKRGDGFGFWPPCYLNFWHHHRRIAPAAPAFILDRKAGDPYGRYESDAGRVTVFGEPHIYSQSTLFHELWHYAERRLISPSECEIVYSECRQGDDWQSDYLDGDRERAARAFEHYASARAHGLQIAPAKKGSAQEIFQKIYEGRAHADCQKRRRLTRWKPWIDGGLGVVGVGGLFGFFLVVLPYFLTH